MATTGLYYPFIHFKDDQWLKLSALYWDYMARVVPDSYTRVAEGHTLVTDSPVTKALASELDFIRSIEPAEMYPVSLKFTELLLEHGRALHARYSIDQMHSWPIDPITSRYGPDRTHPQLAYVHGQKLDQHLAQRLADERLALPHSEGDIIWVGMHPRLADVYMYALAEEIAAHNDGVNPTTDETLDHVSASGWSLPRLAASLLGEPQLLDSKQISESFSDTVDGPDLRSSLAFIATKTIVAKNPAGLTVEKIKNIRMEFGPERFRFQDFVSQVAEELPTFDLQSNPQLVVDCVQVAYERHIATAVDELRKVLRGHGIDSVEAAMCTSVQMPPLLAPLPMPTGEPVLDATVYGAGAAISLWPGLRAKRRAAQAVYGASPVAYLFQLDREATPRSLLQRIGLKLNSFLTGV